MKKIYLGLLTLFALNNINAAIYLQNNYGAAIEYTQAIPEMAQAQPASYPSTRLGYGARADVSRTPHYLSIRSIGGNYSNISPIFTEILIHQANHRGDDALIVIYPRQGLSGIYNWNIKLEWETPGGMSGFGKKTTK